MILLTQGQSMERLFDLDIQLIADSVLTIIAIFALYLAFGYFLFDPVKVVLKNRQEKIQGQLKEAGSSMEQANALRSEYENRLRDIEKEREGILREARAQALQNENEILTRGKEEAARIIERARTEVVLEKQKAQDDIRKEIILVGSAMAGKAVENTLNIKMQEQLLDAALQEIGEGTWLN